MPELPEVETIRRGLSKVIVGKKITDVDIDTPKSFQGDKSQVIGAEIIGIERRAKLIQIKLANNSNNLNLLFHLKLTGQLIYRGAVPLRSSSYEGPRSDSFSGGHPSHDCLPAIANAQALRAGHTNLLNSNTRIIFTFNDHSKLFFNDMRKFGWCKVLNNNAAALLFTEYGLEPLDKNFTVEYLLSHAKRIPNRNIKQFLMDQTIAAGMGNIYTDESLFEARISPLKKIKDISLSEWQKLIDSMILVLKEGLKYGGTTDSDYVNAEGKKGGMQNYLKVYHRTGQKCFSCDGKVERIVVGGRGTHYCPVCQR